MYDAVMVRYGEIGLKGDNRSFFESVLLKNMRQALKAITSADVYIDAGRILVSSNNNEKEIMNCLSTVFGIVSMSPVIIVDSAMEAFISAGQYLLQESGDLKTLRVNCRRADKRFPVTSPEVCRILGANFLELFPGLNVDLHNPDITIQVEIRPGKSMVYADITPGPGGMPVGSGGRGLLLLSGGLDSPVAGWMAMKRGIKLAAVHFFSYPYTGERSKKKVVDLAEKLATYNQGGLHLFIVNFTAIQDQIRENCPEEYRVTIMRRMMLRIAEQLASKDGAQVLITGESVGQVASQTIESMSTISQACSMLQLRPLACLDKVEIMEKARQIETYDISILPFEDCCSLFLPRHPATRPKLNSVLKAETGIDWSPLIEQAAAEVEVINLNRD
ncbi:MAG: tRNA uracil 4-sulfurtransferase ThiI [Syntrophomonadaceae bacterium]|nr:tRNA uracil 4-sulfurtransferase ThiI [Syntrophomonadaceae bacterium]